MDVVSPPRVICGVRGARSGARRQGPILDLASCLTFAQSTNQTGPPFALDGYSYERRAQALELPRHLRLSEARATTPNNSADASCRRASATPRDHAGDWNPARVLRFRISDRRDEHQPADDGEPRPSAHPVVSGFHDAEDPRIVPPSYRRE